MNIKFCQNHPTKASTHVCKKCGKLLCSHCVQITDIGAFCSRECYIQVKDFQNHLIAERPPRQKVGFDPVKSFKRFLILCVVLAILFGYFFLVYETVDPRDMIQIIVGPIRALFP